MKKRNILLNNIRRKQEIGINKKPDPIKYKTFLIGGFYG